MVKTRLATDPRFWVEGGWKIHLAIDREGSYLEKTAIVMTWLTENMRRDSKGDDWKERNGGDKYMEDFTIYLGSYQNLMEFVDALEADDKVMAQLGPSYRGHKGGMERIVGVTGKLSACFHACPGAKGLSGLTLMDPGEIIPLVLQWWQPREAATETTFALHCERFGDYFWPPDEPF